MQGSLLTRLATLALAIGTILLFSSVQIGAETKAFGSKSFTFIISTDGTTVSAMNTQTKSIEFSGPDAGLVINSAINATDSGAIKIEKGSYWVKSTIRPKSDIQIIGVGPSTVLSPASDQTLILNLHPNDPTVGIVDHNLVLGNFRIDYNGHRGDTINLVSVHQARIFQVVIANLTGNGDAIDFDGSDNIVVHSAQFFNIGGSAVHVSDSFIGWTNHKGSSNIIVDDAYAFNVGHTRQIAAFNTFAGDSAIAASHDNTFRNLSVVNSYAGVAFTGKGYQNTIKDSTINGTVSRGIYITGNDNRIENVIIDNATSHGILVYKSQSSEIQSVTVLSSKYTNVAVSNSTRIKIDHIKLGMLDSHGKRANILFDNTVRSTVDHIALLGPAQPSDYLIEESGASDYNTFHVDQLGISVITVGEHTIITD